MSNFLELGLEITLTRLESSTGFLVMRSYNQRAMSLGAYHQIFLLSSDLRADVRLDSCLS